MFCFTGMDNNIYIRPEDTVFLVVNEKHSQYGHIGKMLYGYRVINGVVGVRFPDQKVEEFSGRTNGNKGGDFNLGLKSFYRHSDNKGEDFDKKILLGQEHL